MATRAATITTRVRKPRPRWLIWTKRVFATIFLFFLIGFVVGGFYFVREMGHASELIVSLPDKLKELSTKPTTILSSDGVVLYTAQSEYRLPVKIDEVPKHVKDAILAAEDKRFYDHSGVDYWAMARIVAVGAEHGRLSQGGSTLTMQLAKKFYSEGEKTMNRKLQDVALAITMEREMTKDQILELYLNTMYFGEKAYGIQAAADVYFGKKLDKLTIAECAMLARCVRRPSDENPVKNLDKATTNRNVVLGIMRDEGMVSHDEYENAIAEKVHLSPPKERLTTRLNRSPYFVEHVLQTLAQQMPDIDIKQGGYTIYTTLDSKMDALVQQQMRDFVREHRRDDVSDAAFVLMDKDGKILAEGGGLDFNKKQFNIVTQGQLQPGSSFKPFLYATALSSGALGLGDTLENMPFTYPGTENWPKPWRPQNSDPKREDSATTTVYRAIAMSLNIAAAHVMERVGPNAVADMATGAFGFRSKIARVPALALGACEVSPLEMAQGYSVFMLHGSRATPYVITKIVGPDGETVRSFEPNVVPNQLDSGVADEMDELLKGPIHGTASRAELDVIPNVRGKTGTTSDHKDAWFCGYADGLVGIGWVGNNVIRKGVVTALPMGRSMWGATTAAGIWRDVMIKAHERFASPVPASKIRPDVFRGSQDHTDSGDIVKILPPELPATDGTTGGDGKPGAVPPGTGTDSGASTAGGTTGGDPTGQPPTVGGGPGTISPEKSKPAETTPPKRDPGGRRNDQSDTIQVDVCAESGMRATIYCPETVTRTFKRGQEPKKRCTIHGG